MMYKLSMAILFMTFILMVGLFYILFWPVKIIKPNVQPYKVLTPIVKVGGVLIYQVDACKYLSIQSTVVRTFVDGVQYPSIIAGNNIKKGCSKTDTAIHVPNYVAPGIYHVELDVIYKVNFLRDVTYHFETTSFRVVK